MTDLQNCVQSRENPEPHEAHNPLPLSVMVLLAATLGWAVGYLMAASPDVAADIGDQRSPIETSVGATVAAKLDGKSIFTANCAACHQADGNGVPQVFPPLAGSEWVRGNEALLAQILIHGVTGPMEVAGQQYNGAMPAFGSSMDDAELAAVATYIRSEWGNSAGALSAETVASARAATQQRSAPWKGSEELRSLAP